MNLSTEEQISLVEHVLKDNDKLTATGQNKFSEKLPNNRVPKRNSVREVD
jgi:hypothetical protein